MIKKRRHGIIKTGRAQPAIGMPQVLFKKHFCVLDHGNGNPFGACDEQNYVFSVLARFWCEAASYTKISPKQKKHDFAHRRYQNDVTVIHFMDSNHFIRVLLVFMFFTIEGVKVMTRAKI